MAELVLSEAASAASFKTGNSSAKNNLRGDEPFLKQSEYYYDIKEELMARNKASMGRVMNIVKDEVIKRIEKYPGITNLKHRRRSSLI